MPCRLQEVFWRGIGDSGSEPALGLEDGEQDSSASVHDRHPDCP
jgi:hypothetical protein